MRSLHMCNFSWRKTIPKCLGNKNKIDAPKRLFLKVFGDWFFLPVTLGMYWFSLGFLLINQATFFCLINGWGNFFLPFQLNLSFSFWKGKNEKEIWRLLSAAGWILLWGSVVQYMLSWLTNLPHCCLIRLWFLVVGFYLVLWIKLPS
jgi:hypothetical protein